MTVTPFKRLGRLLSLLFLLIVVVGLARRHAAQGYIVVGESMADTLLPGDVLLINVAAAGSSVMLFEWRIPGYSSPDRYDVVVFKAGEGRNEMMAAKRVVGLPGDELTMREGDLFVNGAMVEEPYRHTGGSSQEGARASVAMFESQIGYLRKDIDPSTYFPTNADWGPLVVPEGSYFLLGDNRGGSTDSRHLGPVSAGKLVGVVGLVLVSHDGSCCSLGRVASGFRWERFGRRILANHGAAP